MIFTFPPIATERVAFEPIVRVTVDAGADLVAHMTTTRDAMATVLAAPDAPSSERAAAIERFLPLAFSFVATFEAHPDMRFHQVLRYTWTSMLFKKRGQTFELSQKYFDVSQLLSALAAERCAQAADALRQATDDVSFVAAAKTASRLLREAAGLFELNADRFLPRWGKLPSPRPPEVLAAIAHAAALVCLAQADELAVKKGVVDHAPLSLLVRLVLNVAGKYDAAAALIAQSGESAELDKAFVAFVAASAPFHRAVALKMLAESFAAQKRDGVVPCYGEAAPLAQEAKRHMALALAVKLPTQLDPLAAEIRYEATALDALAATITRENNSVYFVAPVALALIDIPAPRELSKPIAFELPAPIFTEL